MANSRKSKSNDLTGRVADALLPVVPAGASIAVGLSGGMDSVVLLHLLAELAPRHAWKLSAVHVHHGISPHADDWAAFCGRLCEAYAVPFSIEHVDIKPVRHMGVEAAARHLRHAALARQPGDFVALAHHQDDQAETLLLQLLRGAGVRGLAAMPAVGRPPVPHGEGNRVPVLLRPLLAVSRAELEAFAAAQGLKWVEDESNSDESYPRNFLRHNIIPVLNQRLPGSGAALARSAGHLAEADALLDVLAEQDGEQAFDGETLAVARLAELGHARAKNLLRWFLRRRGVLMPDASRLDEMLRQLVTARQDAQIRVEWGEWALRRYRGRVHVCPRQTELDAALVVSWAGEPALAWPGGVVRFLPASGEGVSAARLAAGAVTVRTRHGEEMLRPDAARPARSLRDLFQAQGVPPWQRTGWPLVYCGDRLVAVPGIAVDSDWRASAGLPGLVLRWDRGAKP
ncbi:MAG TPA: tRNA lysidine(34) synthetase TilS [Gallionellaceae bacterium]|nr:tRNA lysidine(34) synthetase TilS [Gallionellaceae bacterium]